jgi:hypothetical protein
MTALIVGVVLLGLTVFSILPAGLGLNWWPYVADFLRGGIPVLTLLIGLVAVLIGIADIRDRIEEKREGEEENSEDVESSEKSLSDDS